MDIGIVSMRYAKALMAYAKDTASEDLFYDEIRMLHHSLSTNAELRSVLENPVLSIREKLSLITVAAVGEAEPRRELTRFITLVLRNRREEFLLYICLGFIDLYRKSKHIGVAKLTTAVPVNDRVRDRIRSSAASLLHAHMELHTEVDPSIEGGFVFDINHYRLDASIATQLKKVKQQFIDKNRRIV